MAIENKIGRLARNTGPARFFIPVGIVLIIFGAILFGFKTDKYVKTTGTITSVTEGFYDDEQNQQQYDVDFSFDVDGVQHVGTFAGMTGSYKAGDSITVYYDPADPSKTASAKMGSFLPPIMIGVGVLAIAVGVYLTVKSIKKSKALDAAAPSADKVNFDGFKESEGVTEYYFRWDGNSLKPGYLIEDADRNVLFEGAMTKNALVGARTFTFTDHTTGTVTEHQVSHPVTQTYNDGFFNARGWFKIDGENVWDVIHERGIRISTDLLSKFPNIGYNVAKDGVPFAVIRSTGAYVHEDDEAQHKFVVPMGHMFYRFWTNSRDFESLFLIMFATSDIDQTIVE